MTPHRRRPGRRRAPHPLHWPLLLLVAAGVLLLHTAPASAAGRAVHTGMVAAASPMVHPTGFAAAGAAAWLGHPGGPADPAPPGHQGVHADGVCLAVLTSVGLLLGLLLLLTRRRSAGGGAQPRLSTTAFRPQTSFRIRWPPDLHALGVLRL
ncbi:MAG: DUF6153 family protein [Frankiaceae bacterium]